MHRRWTTIILSLLLLTGCLRLPGLVGGSSGLSLSGSLRWSEVYGVQATSGEIANGATVSLIDPATGNTVATTITQPNGEFSLAITGWRPTDGRPYLLEASKGLAGGGTPNRVGASGARLRTLISRVSGNWASLTAGSIQISRSSTALCVIASLKGLNVDQQQALMGRVTIGNPDTFAGNADISAAEYGAVWGMVDAALGLNQDPVRAIARNTATGSFIRMERGPVVTDLSAIMAMAGDSIILYGTGFDPSAANNRVYFNGTLAPNVTLNGGATELTVVIPDDATTGPLTLRIGNLVMLAASSFTVRTSTVASIAGLNFPIAGRPATDWYVTSPQDVAADGAGNLYVSTSTQVMKVLPDGTFTVLAGSLSNGFAGDGQPASRAMLSQPKGLATDSTGNLFIADTSNHRIRMIPATSGTYFGQAMTAHSIYTIAGNGTPGYSGQGAAATAASLYYPTDVAVDGAGNLYIADTSNGRIRMVPRTAGTYFGQAMTANSIYSLVTTEGPSGIAVDAAGNLFVSCNTIEVVPQECWDDEYGEYYPCDQYVPHPYIRMLPVANGTYYGKVMTANTLTTIAGSGVSGYSGNGGAASSAALNSPQGLAVDASGNLFIADAGNRRIRMVPKTGGTFFGQAMTANSIYVVAGNGTATYGGEGAIATTASFNPIGMAVDAAGNFFLADNGNNRIRAVAKNTGNLFGKAMTANAIYTLAGNGSTSASYTGDGGPAANSKLNTPKSVQVDGNGNVFFLDQGNRRVRMIPKTSGTYFGQVMVADNIYTIAGNGNSANTADGTAATGALYYPVAIALDTAGNLYIADGSIHRVRMVPKTGGTYFGKAMNANAIYTIAGNGSYAFAGDGAAATSAAFSPSAIALDTSGNLFIADHYNRRIRMVPATSGTYFGQAMTANCIYTIAGNGTGTFNGNGRLATTAAFSHPDGVALDAAGNVYFTTSYSWWEGYDDEGYYYTEIYDTPNVRMVPRATGTYFGQAMTANFVYTVAGNGEYGYSGDGGLATGASLMGPLQVALDATGTLYIADRDSHRIRMVPRTAGRRYGRAMIANGIYTILGKGTAGFNGDGDASLVTFNAPSNLALTPAEIVIADTNNQLIRKVY